MAHFMDINGEEYINNILEQLDDEKLVEISFDLDMDTSEDEIIDAQKEYIRDHIVEYMDNLIETAVEEILEKWNKKMEEGR